MNHKTRRIIEQLACERRYGIADAKGAEYSGAGSTYKETGADTLRNFKAVAERTGVTPEQALMTYLLKHIDSITTAVREAAECPTINGGYSQDWNPRHVYEKGEGIVSRLDDARNYLDLLECLLHELGHINDDGPDVTGCDGCDDPTCGFTDCGKCDDGPCSTMCEPELERLRRLPDTQQAETPDMIRGYDGILRPRTMPVDTPIIPPLCWGDKTQEKPETGEWVV